MRLCKCSFFSFFSSQAMQPKTPAENIVCAAIKAICESQGVALTAKADFACLVLLLEQELLAGNSTEAIVSLLAATIASIPKEILVLKFDSLNCVLSMLNATHPVAKNTITVTASVLAAKFDSLLFAKLLESLLNTNAKSRKAAFSAVIELCVSERVKQLTLDYLLEIFKSSDIPKILRLLFFVKLYANVASPANLLRLIPNLFTLDLQTNTITADCVYQIVEVCAQSNDFFVVRACIDHLAKFTPNQNDAALGPKFYSLMTLCLANFSQILLENKGEHLDFAQSYYPKLISGLFQRTFMLFDTSKNIKTSILSQATILLSTILTSCVDEAMVLNATSVPYF